MAKLNKKVSRENITKERELTFVGRNNETCLMFKGVEVGKVLRDYGDTFHVEFTPTALYSDISEKHVAKNKLLAMFQKFCKTHGIEYGDLKDEEEDLKPRRTLIV